MKKKKDKYVVYSNPNNNVDFYYKNKKLHREDGPAIVIHKDKDKDKYSNLSDKKLYEVVTEPVVPETMVTHIVMGYRNDIEYITKPWKPDHSAYYLENKQYEKQEFDALILEKELSHTTTPIKNKKLKL